MIYVKVNDTLYEASIAGKTVDRDWDDRASKTISTNTLTPDQAKSIFHDGVAWSIVMDVEQDGTTVQEEYDNSDYNIAGAVTDHRDGYVSITMGKQTDLEQAYELLYGGAE